MEKKVLVAVAAALMPLVGALHSESARAAGAKTSAFEDSTVDASLDPGEERVSAEADNKARLAYLRYAYFIGYNARASEDSKSYATLGDAVKHRQKELVAPATIASPKPVTELVAPARRSVAQAAPPRQVSAPVAPAKQIPAPVTSPKRVTAARTTPSRQVVAQAEPVSPKHGPAQAEPVPLKHVATQAGPVPLKHGAAQVTSIPPRRVSAPVASLKQASAQITPPKRAEVQPAPLKQVATRTTPPKLFGTESEPPILIPTQTVTALPEARSDDDDDAQVTQRRDLRNAQRAAPQYRQADDEPQYTMEQGTQAAAPTQATQNRQPRQYQNQQPQQYAAAPAYNQRSPESQEPGGYAGREYAPPPPRTVQPDPYAPAPYPPARYQPADAQSAYVPRPPAAQQVIIVGRPPAYPAYNEMYTPPEWRRPYPAGYSNSAQPAGYQGWE
jgi:hypothetical protein